MASKSTTFNESNFNTSSNTSSLTINIYFSAENQVTWFDSAWLWCACNGETQGYNVSHPKGGSVWASFTFNNIAHNNDGTKSVAWAWGCNTGTSVLGNITDEGTKTLTQINRYAYTNSVSGGNIENNFSVSYTKYVNTYTYKLRVSIPNVRTLETINYNTSGATFQLSQSTIEDLYNTYPNTDTFNLGFAVETWSGSTKLSTGNEVVKSCSKIDRIGRIRINGEWKKATPYIRTNGEWKKVIPYVRVNSEWKRGR